MSRNVALDDILYTLYEKSIKVQGVATVFYYARPVTEDDMRMLHKIYKLGREAQKSETKEALAALGVF